jgi:hypothetical protein
VRILARVAELLEAEGLPAAAGELYPLVKAGELQLRGASTEEVAAAYAGAADLPRRIELLQQASARLRDRGDHERADLAEGLARYYGSKLAPPAEVEPAAPRAPRPGDAPAAPRRGR